MKTLIFIFTILVGGCWAQSSTTTTYKNTITNTTYTYKVSDRVVTPTFYVEPYKSTTSTVYITSALGHNTNADTRIVVGGEYEGAKVMPEQFTSDLQIGFWGIIVMQLDADTDSLVTEWQNLRASCTYSVTQESISYTEYTDNTLSKFWEYKILSSFEGDEFWRYTVNNGTGNITIRVWKDGSMVSLTGHDYTYIIAGNHYKRL